MESTSWSVNRCYERNSTVLTSNKSFRECDIFDRGMWAVYDRGRHHGFLTVATQVHRIPSPSPYSNRSLSKDGKQVPETSASGMTTMVFSSPPPLTRRGSQCITRTAICWGEPRSDLQRAGSCDSRDHLPEMGHSATFDNISYTKVGFPTKMRKNLTNTAQSRRQRYGIP